MTVSKHAKKKTAKRSKKEPLIPTEYLMDPPIKHWSHSSLLSFLRNPLVWYKRYVAKVFDTPSNPSGIIGRSAHVALQHFYGGISKEGAIELGLEYLRNVPDFEINFGKAKSRKAQREKRQAMERDYMQAISFYLAKPPRHKVLAVEFSGVAPVPGLLLPVKAVSDLVVVSKIDPTAVDIVDHKFVDNFSAQRERKTLFILQAIFNYYTVRQYFGKEVRRFIVYECKKSRNKNGSPQMRRYIIDYSLHKTEFELFSRLIHDATTEIMRKRLYLPNPSDMFDGEHSFDLYRLGIVGDDISYDS
ncbi:MAG: hypothetical protein JWO50_7 [Candidatus Kaiserbacteria bacterium]|nr:hypothetical protein [Candidatus Kaiserbacteria bacterium]